MRPLQRMIRVPIERPPCILTLLRALGLPAGNLSQQLVRRVLDRSYAGSGACRHVQKEGTGDCV